MRFFKQLTLAIVLMAAGATNVQAQYVKVPHAYMFGFVASFNDSTVYFTNIQKVDSVWVTNKKSMLAGRNQYSYQLRDYFAQQRNMPNNTDLKKLEKKYIKMKNKYLVKSKKPYDVRSLNETDFKFLPVDMNYE